MFMDIIASVDKILTHVFFANKTCRSFTQIKLICCVCVCLF